MRRNQADRLMREAMATMIDWRKMYEYCMVTRRGMGCAGCKYNATGLCDAQSTNDTLNGCGLAFERILEEYNVQLERKPNKK